MSLNLSKVNTNPPKQTDDQNAVVLFNAGLGNALQLIPLWKQLQSEGWQLTGFFRSQYISSELIEPLGIFREIIFVVGDLDLFKIVFKNLNRFKLCFLDYHSSSLIWSIASIMISSNALTNREKWYLKFLPNLKTISIIPQGHAIHQHLKLSENNPEKYELTKLYNQKNLFITGLHNCQNFENNFIIIQISAANNEVEYKNWPIENWALLIELISNELPEIEIILVGDKNEVKKGELLMSISQKEIKSLIGNTTLKELVNLVANAKMYLGLDSGTMHLAAMLNVPTLTIWGPTDPITLGYQIVNEKKHLDIYSKLPCHPCHSWIRPNKSLYNHPSHCPHKNCIRLITPQHVFKLFLKHWSRNYPNFHSS